MEDTRISDLAKAIMKATSVREVIDSNGGHVNVGTNRFYLQVNDDVSIIVKTGIDPRYDVWIQNSSEGEGCTVARTMDLQKVAEFVLSVVSLCSKNT